MKNLFKFVIILTITVIFIYAFSSSFISRDMENLAYVVGLGIDKDEKNPDKIKVSFQFVQLYALSDSASSEAPPVFINSVTGNSINSAINEMNTYIGKELNLSHCDIIVFSSDFAKEGISTEIYSLVNNEDIRPSANLVISSSTASSYLENVKPNIEKLVTKYYDTFPITSAFTGYTQDITIGKFYNRLLSDCWDNTVALGEVFKSESSSSEQSGDSSSSGGNESNSSESEGMSSSQGQESQSSSGENSQSSSSEGTQSSSTQDSQALSEGQSANAFNISGKRGTQNLGVGVFKDDKLIGQLSGIETICHLLIINELKSCIISIPKSNDNTNTNDNISSNHGIIDLTLSPKTRPKISVDTKGENPTISIDLFLNADILTVNQSSNYNDSYTLDEISSEAKRYLEDYMNSYVSKVSKEFKTDIDGFARFAIKNFLTEPDWSDYNWQSKYENAKFIINIDINVTSSLLLTELD